MARKEKIINYTPEQIDSAEQMAKILASVPKDQENILVTMVNVFISGVEAGTQLLQKKVI